MTPSLEPLQIVVLALVGLGALLVVVTREPSRQAVAVGVYGLLLALLFFIVQAPDVALSEITVSTVALPLMILLALAKVKGQQK